MKEYSKPIVVVLEDISEGIYAASGNNLEENENQEEQMEKKKCRFGRSEANPGSDACQACSFSGGLRNTELDGESLYRSNFESCIDGMPLK